MPWLKFLMNEYSYSIMIQRYWRLLPWGSWGQEVIDDVSFCIDLDGCIYFGIHSTLISYTVRTVEFLRFESVSIGCREFGFQIKYFLIAVFYMRYMLRETNSSCFGMFIVSRNWPVIEFVHQLRIVTGPSCFEYQAEKKTEERDADFQQDVVHCSYSDVSW